MSKSKRRSRLPLLLPAALVGGTGLLVALSLGDIKRYLRIRSM